MNTGKKNLLLAAAGCRPPPQLLPTPTIFAGGEVDPFAHVPADEAGKPPRTVYLLQHGDLETDGTRD